jgi:uncharacterized integral membrane protein
MTVPEGQYSSEPPKQGRQISAGQIGAGLVVIVGLVFVFENTRKVPIRFLVPEIESPLWLALLITFLLGGLAGYFVSRRRARK